MSTARALRAERPYLRVCRDEIAEAVNKLDARIDTAPHDPTCSPVQVGETRVFTDPFRAGRKGYVTTLLGGEEVIVLVPLRASGSNVMDAVSNLVDVVMREMEPREL